MTARKDPLAVRTMLTKGGFTLSLDKVGPGMDGGLVTASQQRAKEEMERIKEENNKKTYGANQLKNNSAASKSKVAYDALEKIKGIASCQSSFDLKAAFKKFDIDGNGTVDHEELTLVVTDICSNPDENGKVQKIAKWEMAAIIDLFDPNGDGEIDYGEFSWTFYNRRALTNKDADGTGGEESDGGGPETARSGRSSVSPRRRRKKKDPDPVMPKPPPTGGRVRIDDGLHGCVELTPRDERGVPLALLERRKGKLEGEEGDGPTKITSRSGLRPSTSRSGGSGGRPTSTRRPLTAVNSLPNLTGVKQGPNNASNRATSSSRSRQEKKGEWQQWVIKSRQTWVRSAQRSQVAARPVDLRGGVMNRSHPKVPLLWQNNKNGK